MAHFYGSEGKRFVLWNNTRELHVSLRLFTFKLFYEPQYQKKLQSSPTFVTPDDPLLCPLELDTGMYPERD
jgi:hypothetical protein